MRRDQTLVAMAFLLLSVPSSALTYYGNRTVGDVKVSFHVTTDGHLGVLSRSDLVSFTLSAVSSTYSASLSDFATTTSVYGSALTATESKLLFDFDHIGYNYLLLSGTNSVGQSLFYCLQSNGCSTLLGPSSDYIQYQNGLISKSDIMNSFGSQIIATSAPEPTTWYLLTLGFGIIGSTLRRRKIIEEQMI